MLLWLLTGCNGVVLGTGTDTETGWTVDDTSGPSGLAEAWTGEALRGGLGASLVSDGEQVWAGAPWGEAGAVFALAAGLESVSLGEGVPSLGFSLALSPEGVLVAGAPLADGGAGRLVSADQSWSGGAQLGGRVAWTGVALFALAGDQLWRDGEREDLPARGGGFATVGGEPVIGFPRGPQPLLWDNAEAVRFVEGDEMGFSLCATHHDDDGWPDLFIGAPGSGRVYHASGEDPFQGPGEDSYIQGPAGRFGHALSCDEGLLVVGAPLAEQGHGAVWILEGPFGEDPGAPDLVGDVAGDWFGAAVAHTSSDVYAGAPRAHDGAGEVSRWSR